MSRQRILDMSFESIFLYKSTCFVILIVIDFLLIGY